MVRSTVFNAPQNLKILKEDVGAVIQVAPWLVILLVSIVAIVVISQTATASIMFPIVLSIGIPPMFLSLWCKR